MSWVDEDETLVFSFEQNLGGGLDIVKTDHGAYRFNIDDYPAGALVYMDRGGVEELIRHLQESLD